MKRLKLNALNLKGAQLLTREELKKVLGGSVDPGTGGQCGDNCDAASCKVECNGSTVNGSCKLSSTTSKCYCSGGC